MNKDYSGHLHRIANNMCNAINKCDVRQKEMIHEEFKKISHHCDKSDGLYIDINLICQMNLTELRKKHIIVWKNNNMEHDLADITYSFLNGKFFCSMPKEYVGCIFRNIKYCGFFRWHTDVDNEHKQLLYDGFFHPIGDFIHNNYKIEIRDDHKDATSFHLKNFKKMQNLCNSNKWSEALDFFINLHNCDELTKEFLKDYVVHEINSMSCFDDIINRDQLTKIKNRFGIIFDADPQSFFKHM